MASGFIGKVQVIIPLESESFSWFRECEKWDVTLFAMARTCYDFTICISIWIITWTWDFSFIYIFILLLYVSREETQRARICIPIYITARFSRCDGWWSKVRVFSIAWALPSTPYSRSPTSRCRRLADCRRFAVSSPARSSPRCRAARIYCRTSIVLVLTVDRRSTASLIRSDPNCSSARRRSKCPSRGRRVCESRATPLSRAYNQNNVNFTIIRK